MRLPIIHTTDRDGYPVTLSSWYDEGVMATTWFGINLRDEVVYRGSL